MIDEKLTLSPEQESNFELAIKIGIAKELHREKALTDAQLQLVLSDIRRKNARPPAGNAV